MDNDVLGYSVTGGNREFHRTLPTDTYSQDYDGFLETADLSGMSFFAPTRLDPGSRRLPERTSTPSRVTAPYLLSVAVPAYNECNTLRTILDRIRAVPIPMEILIVDDGSTDGTREILRDEIEGRFPDIHVFYHEQNQGKGAAILTAIEHAKGDFLIVQDADLEYDPAEYQKLMPLLVEGKADVVYGSRFMGSVKNMRFPNLVANKMLTWGTNILFPGAGVTDEATCYKVFRTSILKSLPLRAKRFDFCPEVTAKVLKRGIRIHEVPIHYQARTVSDGKKIHWTDGIHAIWTLFKYRFVD